MTKHTVLFRNSFAGIRVEEIGSRANVIMESGSAGTTVRAQDVSADELVAIGQRLVEIGKGMPGIDGATWSDAPKVALTAEDLAFNLATKDCEAWCKVNLELDLVGDAARKKAVDGDGNKLFQEFYRDALSPLLADIRKDEEQTGYFLADGAPIKRIEDGKLSVEGVELPPMSGQLKAILEKRDAPLILPRKSKKKAKPAPVVVSDLVAPPAPDASESSR